MPYSLLHVCFSLKLCLLCLRNCFFRHEQNFWRARCDLADAVVIVSPRAPLAAVIVPARLRAVDTCKFFHRHV